MGKETKKLKNFEVVHLVELLSDKNSILNYDDKDRKLPFNILWSIDGNFSSLMSIYQRIQSAKQKIYDPYLNDDCAEVVDSGWKIKKEYLDEINSKLVELSNADNNVDIEMIPMHELEKYMFTGKELQSIRFMIKEGDDECQTLE